MTEDQGVGSRPAVITTLKLTFLCPKYNAKSFLCLSLLNPHNDTLILQVKKLGSESLRKLTKVTTLLSSRVQKSWDQHPGLSLNTQFPKCGIHTSVRHKVNSPGKEINIKFFPNYVVTGVEIRNIKVECVLCYFPDIIA